jgi:hypothetical protein
MSQLIQCNRCKTTIDATDENCHTTWAELTDTFNNMAQDFPFHLGDECTRDFNTFMERPRPIQSSELAAAQPQAERP